MSGRGHLLSELLMGAGSALSEMELCSVSLRRQCKSVQASSEVCRGMASGHTGKYRVMPHPC